MGNGSGPWSLGIGSANMTAKALIFIAANTASPRLIGPATDMHNNITLVLFLAFTIFGHCERSLTLFNLHILHHNSLINL